MPSYRIKYPIAEDLIAINRHVIQYGGFFVKEGNNLRTPESLDHCLYIIQGLYSFDPYPTLFQKAAFLWCRIASAQIFNDGNKRTATIAATSFLQLNGYAINATIGEMVGITLDMATKIIDVEQATIWIEERAYPKERDKKLRPSENR